MFFFCVVVFKEIVKAGLELINLYFIPFGNPRKHFTVFIP